MSQSRGRERNGRRWGVKGARSTPGAGARVECAAALPGIIPRVLPLASALALALAAPTPSLLGGEALPAGNSQLLGWAGYPSVGFLYAQGLSRLDVGGQLQLGWNRGELEVAGFLRTALWGSGGTALAFRARAGLYACFGATYGRYAHRRDTGLLLAPGLALSIPAGAATLALGLDLPSAVTGARGGGLWLAPTVSASLETPLLRDLTAGARFAVGRRWDAGGAPGAPRSPETVAELLFLVGYRLF